MYSQMGKGKAGGETVFQNVSDGLEKKGHEVIRLYCDFLQENIVESMGIGISRCLSPRRGNRASDPLICIDLRSQSSIWDGF